MQFINLSNNLTKVISEQLSINLREFTFFNKLALISICLLPIFHLTFNDWTGYWVVLSSLFSFISIIQNKKSIKIVLNDPRAKWVIIGLIAYPLAILLSQLCRWSFNHKSYLDTSPFLYFIPVFIFISWKKIDMGRWLQLILPLVIIGAGWSTFYHHRELAFPGWVEDHRLAPYFSDPLAFGQMMITLGIMCLSTIDFKRSTLKNLLIHIWSFLGFLVGIYLSLKSGSRTGWLALPFLILLILSTKTKWPLYKSFLFSLFSISVLVACLYYFSPIFHERINLAILEISSYPWNGGIAPDTSVGLRITFQRLGWFYFSQSPFYGWGTAGYTSIKDAPEVLSFSTQFARDFVYTALFHNELMTQMVRYGILGIIGYFLAVLVPLYICIKKISSQNTTIQRGALICSCFLIAQIIVGFSDEFINLKGMVAFYAYLIVTLVSTVLNFSSREDYN